MSEKSVLVINTPKNCKECDCHLWLVCVPADKDIDEYVDASKTKPDWCPLKPLPQKKNTSKLQGFGNSQIVWTDRIIYQNEGRNACIDELLGETE